MKFRAKPGIGLSYIGQSDLHITYYGLLHVWYIPRKQQVQNIFGNLQEIQLYFNWVMLIYFEYCRSNEVMFTYIAIPHLILVMGTLLNPYSTS